MTPDAPAAGSEDTSGNEMQLRKDEDHMETGATSSHVEQLAEETEPFDTEVPEIYGSWDEKVTREAQRTNFGILCGNWGCNHYTKEPMREHMLRDIFNNPGHELCPKKWKKTFAKA